MRVLGLILLLHLLLAVFESVQFAELIDGDFAAVGSVRFADSFAGGLFDTAAARGLWFQGRLAFNADDVELEPHRPIGRDRDAASRTADIAEVEHSVTVDVFTHIEHSVAIHVFAIEDIASVEVDQSIVIANDDLPLETETLLASLTKEQFGIRS